MYYSVGLLLGRYGWSSRSEVLIYTWAKLQSNTTLDLVGQLEVWDFMRLLVPTFDGPSICTTLILLFNKLLDGF